MKREIGCDESAGEEAEDWMGNGWKNNLEEGEHSCRDEDSGHPDEPGSRCASDAITEALYGAKAPKDLSCAYHEVGKV